MTSKRIGIIMHGVTGRMGTNQHLVRSILEIRRQGGITLKDGTRLMPDPILVGRNADALRSVAGLGADGPISGRCVPKSALRRAVRRWR